MGFRPPAPLGGAPLSPTKSEFEGSREVPVRVPGSATPMRIMMRGGDVRGVSATGTRPNTADGSAVKGKETTDNQQDT
jgi:hypothetical protein